MLKDKIYRCVWDIWIVAVVAFDLQLPAPTKFMQDSFLCVFRTFIRTPKLQAVCGGARFHQLCWSTRPHLHSRPCLCICTCTSHKKLLLCAPCLYTYFPMSFLFSKTKLAHSLQSAAKAETERKRSRAELSVQI